MKKLTKEEIEKIIEVLQSVNRAKGHRNDTNFSNKDILIVAPLYELRTALSGVGEEEKECEHPEVIQIVRGYQCTSCNKII